MTKTEQKVQSYIHEQHLLKDAQQVLIALSGGADSVCLLLMMQRLGYECVAAHCNFHLRGDESNRDEQFVSELCTRLSIPLFKTDFDTHAYAQSHNISIEMAARDLRYAYFARIAEEQGIPTLCVGHHRDDNAETFLLNAVRGTGISGLSGIKEMRMEGRLKIVRPLLDLGKTDILAYLKNRNQSFVTDSTNLIADVGRNKIRLDVMPVLKSINSAAVENLTTTINNMKEVQKVYDAAIKADVSRCETSTGTFSIAELLSCVSPISVLHEWLQGKAFNRTQELQIIEAAHAGQSGKVFESAADSLLVDRKQLVLRSSIHSVTPDQISMITLPIDEVTISRDPHYAYLDADKLQGSLAIRTVQPSDSFQPFGMRGRKLVSDFLTDHKLNLFEKLQQLVITDSHDIAWVVGLRSSEKYRVDNSTKRVVVVQVQCNNHNYPNNS